MCGKQFKRQAADKELISTMGKDVINVALLGLGTVGTGVYKVMKQQEPEMPEKLNTVLKIKKILVRNK